VSPPADSSGLQRTPADSNATSPTAEPGPACLLSPPPWTSRAPRGDSAASARFPEGEEETGEAHATEGPDTQILTQNIKHEAGGAQRANSHYSHYGLMFSAHFRRSAVSQGEHIPGQRCQKITPETCDASGSHSTSFGTSWLDELGPCNFQYEHRDMFRLRFCHIFLK